ncbi:MAG: hypothetical protein CMM08_19690 [Rhodospirillaceae bacterium]|jgi:hypothetical protein|nr:hypothetical protein [Rhodospirillaceae bacterium]|tara:strand:+ start:803 stop:1294 length:492 start_codon:yes stop_codon:yes gene_type:complete
MYWFAFLNRLSKEWAIVSKNEAKQNQYFGFRGWLLILYLVWAADVVLDLKVVFGSPDSDLLDYFGGNQDEMRVAYFLTAIVWVPFLVLAPLKHWLTPKVWIGTSWIEVIVFAAAPDMSGRVDAKIGADIVGVVGAIFATLYVLNSKRVNVTYLNRVPAGEGIS